MGPIIGEGRSLSAYLEKESKAAEESQKHWKPEFEAYSQLTDLYMRFTAMIKIDDRSREIPGGLLLVVEGQMLGVASQLLRRRLVDAQMLTRRAIEATATAYFLWKNPQLRKVFENAYPNFNKEGDPKRWLPSNVYREKFKTTKLFDHPGETWSALSRAYAIVSAKASHAGPGAMIPHKYKDGYCSLSFFDKDDVEIRRSWHFLMGAYWNMLRVFLAMMRSTAEANNMRVFEDDMKIWHATWAKLFKERSYWLN